MINENLTGNIKPRALPGGANEVSSSERPRADALLLDNYKKYSNYQGKKERERCPDARFYCDMIVHGEVEERYVHAILGCKKWPPEYQIPGWCLICGPNGFPGSGCSPTPPRRR